MSIQDGLESDVVEDEYGRNMLRTTFHWKRSKWERAKMLLLFHRTQQLIILPELVKTLGEWLHKIYLIGLFTSIQKQTMGATVQAAVSAYQRQGLYAGRNFGWTWWMIILFQILAIE